MPAAAPYFFINRWLPGYAFAATALFNAHRFLLAAMIAFLPAADSFRLGFGASGLDLDDSPFILAHLSRCAAAMWARPAALILRRLRFD